MSKRKKYTPEFKAKVVRELIESDDSLASVASKYDITGPMLHKWRKELLDNASIVFSKEKAIREAKQVEKDHRKEVDNLNRIIGKTTVERDYLQQCCDKIFEMQEAKGAVHRR